MKKPETGVLSLRLPESDRQRLIAEARKLGVPVSVHTFNLVCRGIETLKKVDLKKSAAVKDGSGEIPTAERSEAPEQDSSTSGPVDQAFLDDIKKRYPGVSYERLMRRLDETAKQTGKKLTRRTVERLFEIASEKAGKR
jgi:hypothetical protein